MFVVNFFKEISLSKLQWTEWSKWSECTAKCNGGEQFRYRLCLDTDNIFETKPTRLNIESLTKLNKNNQFRHKCIGHIYENRKCNAQSCPSKKKVIC